MSNIVPMSRLGRFLAQCLMTTESVIISGPPGVGKSQSVFQAMAAWSRRVGEPVGLLIKFMASYESVDVRGFPIPLKGATLDDLLMVFTYPEIFPHERGFRKLNKSSTVVFHNGEMMTRDEWAAYSKEHNLPVPRYGCLFLDEIDKSYPDVQKPMGELFLKGYVGDFDINDLGTWRVWGARNRVEDRSGSAEFLGHIQNRIVDISVIPDPEGLKNFIFDHGYPSELAGFVEEHFHELTSGVPKEGMKPYPTPRTLIETIEAAQAMAPAGFPKGDIYSDEHVKTLAAGKLGTFADALFAYLESAKQLPPVKEILKHPDTAELPGNSAAKYRAMYVVPDHVQSEKDAEAMMTYLRRAVPAQEQLSVSVTRLTKRDIGAYDYKCISDWLEENQETIREAYS